MFNLFDILQSQAGPGMQSIGQQFGLSSDQTQKAMQALLPALAMGLQHNAAADPMGFGRLFGLAGSGMTASSLAQSPTADLLMGQLFGSPAVSQAILQQAAATSGIAIPALRQMLPVMAGMVVAGIVHVMLNQQQELRTVQVEAKPKPSPFTNPASFFTDWVEAIGGSAPSASGRAKPPESKPQTTSWTSEWSPPASTNAAAAAKTPDDAPSDVKPKEPAMDALGQLFQTGIEVQEQNVKVMQDIFESYWSRPETKAATKDEPSATKADFKTAPKPAKPAGSVRRRAKPAAKKSTAEAP